MLDDEDDTDAHRRLLAGLEGATTVPGKNGELVFKAPRQGLRVGSAVALSEQGVFPWTIPPGVEVELQCDTDNWRAILEMIGG